MNKEEILEELNRLKDNLPEKGLDDAGLEQRVQEVAALNHTRNSLSEQIKKLEAKLNDEQNYVNKPLQDEHKNKRLSIERSINEASKALLDAKAKSISLNGKVELLDTQLNYINSIIGM